MDVRQAVAGEVRAEAARRRVSQRAIAVALGVSQTAVSRRLNGEIPFDVDELGKVAELLGVPPAQFLERVA